MAYCSFTAGPSSSSDGELGASSSFSPGPSSASGGSGGIFLLPPGSFPPSPPLKTAKLASEGGEGHGGKEKYAARLPSDRRCQFLKGYSGSESGGRQFLRDHNVAERSRSAMLIPDEITADTPRTGVRNCNGHIAKNIARRL